MAEIRRSADLYGILLDANARVLMLPNDSANWTLPCVQEPESRSGWPMVGALNRLMSAALTADVTVLRQVYLHAADAQATHVEVIYTLENHSANWPLPPRARWIERKVLAALKLAHPGHQAAIEEAMAEAESGLIPDLRPPWARPGWFDAASAWMRQQLDAHGYHLTAPIEQFKSWGISCLLRVETGRGAVYFKVAGALPLFGNEPALLQALSERFPDYVPPPIAVDVERRWMLMGDFGAEFGDPALERWEEAVQRFARLQIQSASMIDDLLSIGCLDRRLDVLAAQIDPLLSDESVLTELNAYEIARVRSHVPHLKAMCRELAGYRVPFTLNHGDLHTGNITRESLLFFDWTDACIAHPFLDLPTVMMDMHYRQMTDARERIVDAYLGQWSAYEPMERLREMWRLAEPLGALHQAVSYQHIVNTLEPPVRERMLPGVTDFVRRLIKTMPDSDSKD